MTHALAFTLGAVAAVIALYVYLIGVERVDEERPTDG